MGVFMIRTRRVIALGGVMLASSAALAGTATNTMTSVATVTDACDIAAVGIDFGLTSLPLPAAGITSLNPNTTAGTTTTGNTSNPNAADDGGAGNDDTLSITLGDAATNTLISNELVSIDTTVAGVFVACTTTPTSISVTSANAAGSFALPTSTTTPASGTFNGKMVGIGGGATASNLMDYTLTFVGTPVSTAIAGGLPLNLFTAEFVATGNIPASQSGTVVPGYYADVATAQVDF